MNTILLTILDLFKDLYRLAGVDYKQLRAIVDVKLSMDNRRNVISFRQNHTKEQTYGFLMVMLVYGIFGLLLSMVIWIFPSFIMSMALFHAFLIVMLTMTLISDYSSVLLDTSDNTIILPRPVNSKTLLAARTTHIMLYLGQVTFGLMIVPIITVLFKYGLAISVAMIITSILSVLFSLMLTNGLYLILMRFSSEERLKSIINYFQILMAMIMMGGYQILPRLLERSNPGSMNVILEWWSAFIPPLWMAGSLDILYTQSFDLMHGVLALLAVTFPIVAFLLMNKYLTPMFASKLADLGVSTLTRENKSGIIQKNPTFFNLRNLLTKPGLERASYNLVTATFQRDRKLKLKIYPSIGLLVIFGFAFLLKKDQSFQTILLELPERDVHIFMIYATFLVIQVALFEIGYSDNFKASWIYSVTPIEKPGEILSGTWKAIIARFFLPIYAIITILIIAVWRLKGIDDVLFGACSNMLIFLLLAKIYDKHLPVSMEPNARKQAGSFARSMLVMILVGIVGTGHYYLTKVPYALWMGIPLCAILTSILANNYKRTSWDKIQFN